VEAVTVVEAEVVAEAVAVAVEAAQYQSLSRILKRGLEYNE
jgi:hypothetical protein